VEQGQSCDIIDFLIQGLCDYDTAAKIRIKPSTPSSQNKTMFQGFVTTALMLEIQNFPKLAF